MKIITETSFERFEPWSGAVSTHTRICDAGLAETFEGMLEDIYPDGMTDTQLNDLLWFEPDTCYEWLGLRTESQIQEEIDQVNEELEEAQTRYDSLMDKQFSEVLDAETEGEKSVIYDIYSPDLDSIAEEIDSLQQQLAELQEELEEVT